MQLLYTLIKKTYRMSHPGERRVVMNNAAYLSALQVITYILPIVIIPYLFRVLGAEKFGLLAFAQAFMQYFMMLTDYGFNISATKEISLCRNDHAKVRTIFSSVMLLKIVLIVASAIIIAPIVCYLPKFRNDWMVYVLSFGMVAGNALFPVWFFQGIEKMKYIANINIIGGLIFTLLIFLLVKGPQDYLMVPIINSVVFLLTGLIALSVVIFKFKMSFTMQAYKHLKHHLKAGWDIFISVAAINAYTTTRIFCIGLLTNNTITGFYSIAERIANVCQTFPLLSFSQAIFPRLSAIFRKNKNKALILMKRIQQITIRIALICLPVIFIGADSIVKIVFGGEFPETALSLRLLLISVFFVSANAFRVQFLLVCGKTKIYSRIHVYMALLALPFLFILTHYFSYIGTAVATIMIEAGIFVITYITVSKLKFPNERLFPGHK
jgi:polysaccharide transporter, PST family